MTPIVSVWDELRDLILEQYKESGKYTGIIKAITEEADKLETARFELAKLLDIDAMIGAQLDLLGKIAVTPRLQSGVVLDDASYRLALKAAFRARYSGTPEEIISAVRSATDSTQVLYIPEYPAGFWILADGPIAIDQDFLERLSPAGVLPFLPCFLETVEDAELIVDAHGSPILIVGPCSDTVVYPEDNVWDGGLGPVDPDTMVFTEAWPFRGTNGIGEQPDGGMGEIDPHAFTFKDGTYAEDTGG